MALVAPSGVAAAATGKPQIRALVVRDADSPIIKALKRQLGKRVKFRRAAEVPARKQQRFDLLVVDGDHLSPARMRNVKTIDKFTSSHRWVLGLDLERGHHRRAVERHTGFRPHDGDGDHSSRAFLFSHQAVDGSPTVSMLDAPRLRPYGAHRVGDRQRKRSTRREARRVARMITRRVKAGRSRLARVTRASTATPGDQQVDGDPQRVTYDYSVPGSSHPKDGYYTKGRHPGGVDASDYLAPQPGFQTVTWVVNRTFNVYLDNAHRPQGNFQIVTYDVSLQTSPKRDGESFFHMYDPWGGLAYGQWERAWWTGLIRLRIKPSSDSDSKLRWENNAPRTPNQERETSSEQGFSVGFSGSQEGVEASGEFHYSVGESVQIPDWGVESTTSGNHVSWEYSSRGGCDPRSGHEPAVNCFDYGAGKGAFPKEPNGLSRGQNVVEGTGRWVTQKDQRNAVYGPGEGKMTFEADDGLLLITTYCSEWGVFACSSHDIDRFGTGPGAQSYTIDVSDVLPIDVKTFSLDPGTVNGAKAEIATGTVSLERPVPFDTSIFVYSDSQGAKLKDGTSVTSSMTRKEITVPKGESEATFVVNSNDNDLQQTGRTHWTATLTAFAAGQPKTAQLCIVSTPGGSCTGP